MWCACVVSSLTFINSKANAEPTAVKDDLVTLNKQTKAHLASEEARFEEEEKS